MTNLVRKLEMPLLEGYTKAADVFSRDDLMVAGGVVARQGETYRLISMTEIAAKAEQQSDFGLSFQLWEVDGPPMALVPPDVAGLAGFDFDNPDPNAFKQVCQQLGAPLLAGPNSIRDDGQMLISSYLDLHQLIRARLDRRVYFCQAGREPYSESEYRQLGGTCPSHFARLV